MLLLGNFEQVIAAATKGGGLDSRLSWNGGPSNYSRNISHPGRVVILEPELVAGCFACDAIPVSIPRNLSWPANWANSIATNCLQDEKP
jgi:hypothetical protein